MISAVAVSLALAFWTPYNDGQPVCPDGVSIHHVTFYGTAGSVPGLAYTLRENGQLVPNCNVYIDPTFQHLRRPMQCAFVARALGAAWFGLPASSDRRNVMYGRGWVVPGACRR